MQGAPLMARGGVAQARVATVTEAVPAQVVRDWARHARPGDEFIYHKGAYLLQSLPAVEVVRELQGQGLILLYQRRVGPSKFDYCARRRAAPERRPSSCHSIDQSGLDGDRRALLKVLTRIAKAGRPCPSNHDLAEMVGLNDRHSVRYRMISLMQSGHIEIISPPDGSRVIVILATGDRTAAGGEQ